MHRRIFQLIASIIALGIGAYGCSLPGWDKGAKPEAITEAVAESGIDITELLIGTWQEWSEAAGAAAYIYNFYQNARVMVVHQESGVVLLTGIYEFLASDAFSVIWSLPESGLSLPEMIWTAISADAYQISFSIGTDKILTLKKGAQQPQPVESGPPVSPPTLPPVLPPVQTDSQQIEVRINEVELNAPCGGALGECMDSVELYNPGEHDISIGGWLLFTAHGESVVIPSNIVLASKSFYVIEQSNWLVNVDEALTLMDNIGQIIDTTPVQSDTSGGDIDNTWQLCPNARPVWIFKESTLHADNGC